MSALRPTLPRRPAQVATRAGQERLLNILLLGLALGATLVALGILLFGSRQRPLLIQAAAIAGLCWALIAARQLTFVVRAGLFVMLIWASALLNMAAVGVADQGRLVLLLFILFALTFLGRGAAIGAGLLSVVTLWGMGWAQATGRLPGNIAALERLAVADSWFVPVAGFILFLGVSLYIVQFIIRDQLLALERQQALSTALQEQRETLEETVSERTRALNLAADLGRELTQILRRDDLLRTSVKRVQDAFDFYYVQIYIATENGEFLQLAAGSGGVGRELARRGHRLALGRGLVGRAAAAGDSVLIPDVTQASGWLANPLLPGTRAELAVPIMAGERVLGVLDVQHDVLGGLGDADRDLLESIAGQLGVALQNIDLLTVSEAQVQRAARLNRLREAVQRTTDLESLAQVAARELGAELRIPQTRVTLYPRRLRPLLVPADEEAS